MSGAAIVTMAVICALVWGGFAALLARALSRERARRASTEGAGRASR